MINYYLVQHGEKVNRPGDPPLSAVGMTQARVTAVYLRDQHITRLFSSPLCRAVETAQVLADTLGLLVGIDDRLRERMNWGASPEPQTLESFLAEWARASIERDFRPAAGDSSHAAGARLLALLDELAGRYDGERVALVSHGGVTLDALRNLFPDVRLNQRNPAVLVSGIPGCAITRLTKRDGGYELHELGSVAHLPGAEQTLHQP